MSAIGTILIRALTLAALCLGSVARADVTPSGDLGLPRFVSLKAAEGRVRRGPSFNYRIDWVFTRRHMPLRVTAEYGNWRRVEDRDGQGGWVHYSLLSGARTVIVEADMLALYARPDSGSQINAQLEQGVVARLGECTPDMCRLSAGGYSGWADRSAFWGLAEAETTD